MTLGNVLSLLGGIGAFLFGIKFMGEGLQNIAGSKMKALLERLTRRRWLGFLLGMWVTVVIQSSSATTVMVMGFLNAGMMDLTQATGVIFGANMGTTVTSLLIALDVSGVAPICFFIGALSLLYPKKEQLRHIGQVIFGFGLLFQGLHTMSSAMSPLKEVLWFQNFIVNAQHPLLGLAVGALLCALIQSSSAAVGIVQALAMQGLMPLHFASFLVCGINVGSSVPVFLGSVHAHREAKRAAVIYLLYNLAGAVIMGIATLTLPYAQWISGLTNDPALQVSMMHILFKAVAALALLPLTGRVVALAQRIIGDQ